MKILFNLKDLPQLDWSNWILIDKKVSEVADSLTKSKKGGRYSLRRLRKMGQRRLYRFLPREVYGMLVRRAVRIDYDLPDDIICRAAESDSEIRQALEMVQTAFIGERLTSDFKCDVRISKYHALPTTKVLVVLKGNEIVATLTMILDGKFGIPVEKIVDISEIRKQSGGLAEVSTLAVNKKYRHKGGRFLFPLYKTMVDYCREYWGVHHLFMAVTMANIDFDEHVLRFDVLARDISYDYAGGSTVGVGHLDLDRLKTQYKDLYEHHPKTSNLYYFFNQHHHPRYVYKNNYGEKADPKHPQMSKELFFDLYYHRAKVGSQLSNEELQIIMAANGWENNWEQAPLDDAI